MALLDFAAKILDLQSCHDLRGELGHPSHASAQDLPGCTLLEGVQCIGKESCDSKLKCSDMLSANQFTGKDWLFYAFMSHSCAVYGIYGIYGISTLTSTEVDAAPLVKASNCSLLSCSLEYDCQILPESIASIFDASLLFLSCKNALTCSDSAC